MSQNSATPPKRSANIFISYRREDTAGHAGRLFDGLSGRFRGRVFMDVDTIEPGVDFVDVIVQAVGKCEVLIVMIGRDWLSIKDAAGCRRLDNPKDFVRLEVGKALERDIRVIPVLVEDAVMPRPEDLPPDLVGLTRRNAIELSDARWVFDVDRLIQTIERVLQESEPSAPVPGSSAPSQPVPSRGAMRPRAWMAVAALALLALTGWTGWRLMKRPAPPQETVEVASLPSTASPEEPPPETAASPEEPPPETAASPEEPSEMIEPGGEPMGQDPGSVQQTVAAPAGQPQPALRPDACKKGFVWREAGPADHVCVTLQTWKQTAEDNLQAEARRDLTAYDPEACLPGYVWREAFAGDHVCVTPETRDQARSDNAKANERKMRPAVRWAKSLFKGGQSRPE